ncbi:hypothetical protein [Actinomadura sp. 7K507]|uniref:hypothetical protein n=1 Tax=Actinomadura sp. 7K507 TaxID=2530365 RepID=UPI001052AD52|nr:hypothetical protein [Actinomadura sp. 7K507]TDC80973.1 hypothetical protein E1285_33800 [Actinomadura sp. 7K507]
MGARAHYVIKDGDSWERYYSQWGGYSLELDMLAGPDPATRFAGGQRPDPAWMFDGECDGAVLIDHGESRLLWYSVYIDDAAYRAAALAVMGRTWPGWRIDWAYQGLGDIVAAVGEEPTQVDGRYTLPPEPRPLQKASDYEPLPCLVTVAQEGSVRAHMLETSAESVIGNGAGSLATYYLGRSPVDTWPRFPGEGVHLDVDARRGGVWTLGTFDRLPEAVEILWPGWEWEHWQGRYREQLGRAAGAVAVPEPDRREGLRKLVEQFDRHQEVDAATEALSLLLDGLGRLTAAAGSEGMRATTVLDNSFAHRPMDLSDEERAGVHIAFAAILGDL